MFDSRYLTSVQQKRRAKRILKYVDTLYIKEQQDISFFIQQKMNLSFNENNFSEVIWDYICSLSLKSFKEIQKRSSKYSFNLEKDEYDRRHSLVSFYVEDALPVYTVTVARNLESTDKITYFSINNDEENYVPISRDVIAKTLVVAAEELLAEGAELDKASHGYNF